MPSFRYEQTAVLLTTLDSQKIYHFNFQALKDLDFEVRDRLFLESVMDIEFQDSNVSEKAIFYKGTPIINSHALSFYKSKNIFGRSKLFYTVRIVFGMSQNSKYSSEKTFLVQSKTTWADPKSFWSCHRYMYKDKS